MAARDIMPWTGPNGGTPLVQEFSGNFVADSETFETGEPVYVDQSGDISESADLPTVGTDVPTGIAVYGPGSSNITWETGAAFTNASSFVQVWIPTPEQQWITPNFSSAGSAFDDVAPLIGDVGMEIALKKVTNDWGISISPGSAQNIGRITDILNGRKQSIKRTGESLALQSAGGTYYVVFTMLSDRQPGTEVQNALA